jgi:hypothetical protein
MLFDFFLLPLIDQQSTPIQNQNTATATTSKKVAVIQVDPKSTYKQGKRFPHMSLRILYPGERAYMH